MIAAGGVRTILMCTALCVTMLSGCGSGTPSTPKAFAVGERVTVGPQALTVLGVMRVPESEIKPSQPAHSVVAVECVFDAVEDTTVSPMTDLHVTDGDGHRYKPITAHQSLDGGLRRGQKTRGGVLFEVPTDAKDLRLEFSLDGTRGYAVIKLVDEI